MTERSWAEPLRVVQFLLRNVDALEEEPADLVNAAAEWGANALLLNAAGFTAWYPTRLPYQQTNPFLRNDFLGEAVQAARRRGIAVFARVDVSKTHPAVADTHPDWLRYTAEGTVSTEWEMPETCFTGPYWQTCNEEIVGELLGAYPVDGLFYNMYRVAHCHCPRCTEIVRAATGLHAIPRVADPSDAAWRVYQQWRRRALVAYTARLRDTMQDLRPGVALLVYHHQKEGWDVPGIARASDLVSVTASSPLAVNPLSPQPDWVGWAGFEAALARGLRPTRPGVVVTTTSALFASRRAAQPFARLASSMLQVAFNRGAPCPAIPGGLRQDDPRALPVVAQTLAWLAANQATFTGLASPARIALLASRDTLDLCPLPGEAEAARLEERGLYLALEAARWPFDIVPVTADGVDLEGYDLALLPDHACLSDATAAGLDRWVADGGDLLVTGYAGAFHETGEPRDRSPLACLRHPRSTGMLDLTGAFLAVEDAGLQLALGGARVLGVDRQMIQLDHDGAAPDETTLHLLGPVRNNTPEFAVVPREWGAPGLYRWRFGRGQAWHLPWRPGVLIADSGLPDPAAVIQWIVRCVLGEPPVSIVGAGSAVEVRLWEQPSLRRTLLFLLNTAARQTTPLTEETRIGPLDIRVHLDVGSPLPRVKAMHLDQDLPCQWDTAEDAPGTCAFTLPWLGQFEVITLDR